MLEQSFEKFQKEIGKSIRELNENATITLGLVQTLVQESKPTWLRMEMLSRRLDQLEAKSDAHTALLNTHTTVLNEHTATLNEHTARFDRLETMLAEVLTRLPEKP